MLNLIPFETSGNNIFNYLDNIEKNFFGSFHSNTSHFRTDIIDEGDRFILTADIPGYEKENISIDVSEDMLTVKAEKQEETENSTQQYVRRERHMGVLSRSFNVSNIETDEISAEYKNGVLELILPKKVPEKPAVKRISVQ